MRKAKTPPDAFALARPKLEAMGFQILAAPAPASGQEGASAAPPTPRWFVMKYGCAAGVATDADGHLGFFARPGRVVAGELARLIDRGFQKFLKTADEEIAARSEDLRALHDFERDLRFAAKTPLLYNEALGSVSDRYLYDRIWFRDQAAQPRVWEDPKTALPRSELPAVESFPVSAPTGGGH